MPQPKLLSYLVNSQPVMGAEGCGELQLGLLAGHKLLDHSPKVLCVVWASSSVRAFCTGTGLGVDLRARRPLTWLPAALSGGCSGLLATLLTGRLLDGGSRVPGLGGAAVALGTLMGVVLRDDVVQVLKGCAYLPVLCEIIHQGLQKGVVVDSAGVTDDRHVAPSTGDSDIDPPILSQKTNFT